MTWIQSFTIASIAGVLIRVFYERTETAQCAKTASYVWLIVAGLLYALNYFRYNMNVYENLSEYWINEGENARNFKGVLVVACIVCPIVPLMLVGLYW